MLLGEVVVEAVSPIEPVIGPHEALHLVDEIPEDLHAAHAEEILRLLIAVLDGVGQRLGQPVDLRLRVRLIGGHARQEVAAYLGAGLHEQPQVRLPVQGPVHQIPHRLAHGHRPVAVAELAVVVELEPIAHGVVPDGIGIDDGRPGLDVLPKEPIEAVLMDAGPVGGAAEAPQTPAPEGEGPQIHHPGLVGQPGPEPVDHGRKGVVLPFVPVGDDHHRAVPLLHRLSQGGHDPHEGLRGPVQPGLGVPPLHLPQDEAKEGFRLLPALLGQQVLHVGGQAPKVPEAQIVAVVPDEAMGGHVVKVFGGGDLGGVLAGQVQAAALHELQKPVELGRDKKGIDRIAEQDQVGPKELLLRLG